MDFEQAIETQRLRLLRMIAGLIVLVGFICVGPVSHRFSIWICGFVGSFLARAEAAAQCLVIAQARLIARRRGFDTEQIEISEPLALADETVSLSECKRRLRVLRTVLLDLPRYARRLMRRIAKQASAVRSLPCSERRASISLCRWQLVENRIERPPDGCFLSLLLFTSLGFPAGGAVG